jgi:hypothetical protein
MWVGRMMMARGQDIAFLVLRQIGKKGVLLISLKQEPATHIAFKERAIIATLKRIHQVEETRG